MEISSVNFNNSPYDNTEPKLMAKIMAIPRYCSSTGGSNIFSNIRHLQYTEHKDMT